MSKRRGFTLVEVLLALAIFTLVVVAAIEGIALQLRAQQVAEDTTRAVMLAENLVEEIKFAVTLEETEESGEFSGGDAMFSWHYRIADHTTPGLYNVTVSVMWSDGRVQRYHTIETLLAERVR